MREKITSIATSIHDDLINLLRDMIAIPSYSGKEGAVIERMKQEMQNLGYDQVWVDPLGNLLGRIGSGNKVIAIDGHCDTCLLYTSPSPRDRTRSRMPSSA